MVGPKWNLEMNLEKSKSKIQQNSTLNKEEEKTLWGHCKIYNAQNALPLRLRNGGEYSTIKSLWITSDYTLILLVNILLISKLDICSNPEIKGTVVQIIQ